MVCLGTLVPRTPHQVALLLLVKIWDDAPIQDENFLILSRVIILTLFPLREHLVVPYISMMENKSSSEVLEKAIAVEHTENQGVLLYTEDGTIRQIPVPSSNPNDPLNFSPWRQRLILTAACVYGITGFGAIQSTPLFFGKIIIEYMQKTHGVRFTPLEFL